MKIEAVESTYSRWAPVYDRTFGAVTNPGRRRAVRHINRRSGRVLEVGVGTGLALPLYHAGLRVTGIDYSAEMLAKARTRVEEEGLSNVVELRRMDARDLDFPDASFETVAAMHVLSVVPEPARVMSEIARVLTPGGHAVITNHFRTEDGPLAAIERASARFADTLGWHSDFEIAEVLGEPSLKVRAKAKLPPLGLMTFLVLEKSG